MIFWVEMGGITEAELAEMEATGMKYGSLKVFKAHSRILKQLVEEPEFLQSGYFDSGDVRS